MLAATGIGCVRHAWASKIDDVAGPKDALRYRALILWLHFVQPWARVRGRIKGYFSDSNFSDTGRAMLANAPRLMPLDALRLTLFGLDKTFWDTHYTPTDTVLTGLRKRSAGALTPVRCDDGFGADYDVLLRAGRTYAIKLKIAAEDHGGMNRLYRVRLWLDRPWMSMFMLSAGLALFTGSLLRMRLAMHSWVFPVGLLAVVLVVNVLGRVGRHGGQVLHAVKSACTEHGIQMAGDTAPPLEADQHRPVMG